MLAHCNLSLALAINDVVITSSLGEPLIAQINITDVEKSPDTNCFSVTDSSTYPAFTNATLTIKHHADGYQLIIKSHQVITEPILNLRVAYHCDPNISRDYVLLLDPPLQNYIEPGTINSTHNLNTARSPVDTDSNTTPTRHSANVNINISKNKTSQKAGKTSSINQKLAAIYTGLPTATAKSKPYLSISGGSSLLGEAMTLPNPALRLETRIDLTREVENPPLSATDVMDEITAIDNRLTLLRTQIISLQSKNDKLKNDAENAKRQLEYSKTTLRIAAGLVALLAIIAFAVWLRGKLAHERLVKAQDNWLDNSNSINDTDDLTEPAINNVNRHTGDAKHSNFNDAFDENSTYDIASGFSAQPAYATLATSINTNVKEDILESVDVLTEYGRFGLAIHLLQDYLADHPSESPKVWLKLLSLIAAHGNETEYAKAITDCNNYYHIHMPSFVDAKKVGTATIEDFPYITRELEMAWGTANAVTLLNDLIYNSASQPDEGFEPEIFEQLFLLKQIAENLNPKAANTDAIAEQAAINTNKNNPEPDDAKSSRFISQAVASITAEPIVNDHEMSADEIAANWGNAPPQVSQLPETFPALNFDDYVTQHNPAEMVPSATEPHVARLPSFDENDALAETKPALGAPEIDFSQHVIEVGDTSAQNSATPAIGDKQQKRIVKDSNLIDWVLTDEN